jgi:uncharacterized protein (DUF2237 family)
MGFHFCTNYLVAVAAWCSRAAPLFWNFVSLCGILEANSACSRMKEPELSVLDQPLQVCCTNPMTGWYRDGSCRTDEHDHGSHVVCAVVTDEFLDFTRSRGNDLQTPRPEFRFPGLKAGDRWCLCALRWREAWEAGKAPPVVLESTNRKALDYISLEVLVEYAYVAE